MLIDNYAYYVFDPKQPDNGFYVDVGQMHNIDASRKVLGLPTLKDTKSLTILTTHKHWDHSQGNVEIPGKFPHISMKVIGNREDHVPGVTEVMEFGQ